LGFLFVGEDGFGAPPCTVVEIEPATMIPDAFISLRACRLSSIPNVLVPRSAVDKDDITMGNPLFQLEHRLTVSLFARTIADDRHGGAWRRSVGLPPCGAF